MTEPLNSIAITQNNPRQLDRLGAQRHLYSKAKKILTLHVLLTIPTAVLWSIMIAIITDLKVWAGLYSVIISALGLFLSNYQKSLKCKAAKIQEVFDCEVLNMPWNELQSGHPPDAETVQEAADSLKRKSTEVDNLRNWYPEVVGKVEIQVARLVCQRTNLWWDSNLRRRYATWLCVILSLTGIIVVVIGLIGKMTIEKLTLAILAPLLPALLWGVQEYKSQTETAKTLDRVKEYVGNVWTKTIRNTLSVGEAETESRKIQDHIYNHRCQAPLIFDWVYKLLRNKNEKLMNKGAQELIEEALKLKTT